MIFILACGKAAVIDTEAGKIEERALTHVTVETELLYRMVARSALLGWKPGNGQTSMLNSPRFSTPIVVVFATLTSPDLFA